MNEKTNQTPELTEEEILNRLLNAGETPPPQSKIQIKRLGINLVVQGIKEDVIEKLREQSKYRVKTKQGYDEETDSGLFTLLVINAGTVSPKWSDPKLIAQYKASSPEKVISKILLPGEISEVCNVVLELSGYGDDSVEEIKN